MIIKEPMKEMKDLECIDFACDGIHLLRKRHIEKDEGKVERT